MGGNTIQHTTKAISAALRTLEGVHNNYSGSIQTLLSTALFWAKEAEQEEARGQDRYNARVR